MGKSGGGDIDYEQAAQDAVYADIETLPFRRLIETAARGGESVTVEGKTYDFTGLGDADAAAANARTMGEAMLALQQKYGAEYVQQRVKELELADPEGQAARRQLYQQVQEQLRTAQTAQRPAAEALEKSVLGELDRGATLDPEVVREVQQGVRGQQAGRGNVLGNAAATQEARAVAGYGEAMQGQRQQEALNYLTSGVSPEDVTYRRVQQAQQNVGDFLAGTTPTAQFAGISSAGGGAAPFLSNGGPTTGLNPNAAGQGASNAMQQYQQTVNWQGQQANPYIAGTGLGARAYGVYQAARPVKPGTP